MIPELSVFLTAIKEIQNPIQRQYILAAALAEIKDLESTNRDILANKLGEGKHEDDTFSIVVKVPLRHVVNQEKVLALLDSGWPEDVIEAAFPIKFGYSAKGVAAQPSVKYAVEEKIGKPTIKITRN